MTSQKQKHQNSHHIPVLLEATLETLKPQKGETYLDLTAGFGGHASAVISATQNPKGSVLIDRDPDAVNQLKQLAFGKGRPMIECTTYGDFARSLVEKKKMFDMVLLDLGVSSYQLDNDDRGFSFNREGPLDMRMSQSGQTAAQLVNTVTESELEKLLREYGEEPKARQIAKAIIEARPIVSTTQLADVVSRTVRGRGKKHPATRTFQSLRIAVNDELGQLKTTLPILPDLLNPGGRLAIISFHSLEDRLVKEFLLEDSRSGYEARLKLINKKPIKGDTHDVFNRRARSARLRGAVKIKTK